MKPARPGRARVLSVALALLLPLLMAAGGAARAAPGTDGLQPDTGTLRILRRIVIATSGQVEETRELRATGRLSHLWRDETEAIRRVERFGWRLDTVEAADAFTLRLHRQFRSFEEFNREHAGSIQVIRHPLYDEIEFRDDMTGVDKGLLQRVLPQPLGVDSVQWVDSLTGAIRLEREVTLPGKVTRTSMGTVEGRTVRWGASLGDLGAGPVSLVAGGRAYRPIPVLLLGGGVVLVVGGTITIVLTRRWWDPERQA